MWCLMIQVANFTMGAVKQLIFQEKERETIWQAFPT